MARYTIDFSTNASRIADEIQKVNKAISETTKKGKQNKITLELDTTKLRTSIDSTFRELDKQIAAMQRKLAGMQIGSRRFQQQATGIGIAQGMRERGGMQARAIQLGAQAEAFDIGSATRLTKQLEAARIEANQIAPNTEPWINLQRQIGRLKVDLQSADRLAENVQMRESLGAFEPGSLNALEAKLTILRNRAREIAPTAAEWKKVNAEIVKTEQSIEKQTRRPLTRGQRMGAAGGAFLYGGGLGGGLGSAAGGIAGGLIGGVPGAFTGAAIGQAVDNLTAMTAAMTEQAVAVQKLRLGLASASNSLQDYTQAVREVEDLSNKLLIPVDEVTRKFTQLRASTVALGIDTKTTSEMFEGVAAAVLMSGGSLQDVDGAMRAVVQVFSKGKLTAEELRGQLGERLPGAVVEFARSSGRSLQELDKAFEQGGATLDEFVLFLRAKKGDTEDFVREMASSSEFAGARMAKAFERMRINIGRALQPTGAAIQDFVTRSINGLDKLINKAIELKLIQPGADFYANRALLGGAGGIAGLEQQLLQAGAEETAARGTARAAGLGFIENLIPDVTEATEKVRILEDALKKIRREEKLTKQREAQITSETEQQKRDATASKFLDTIERREQAIANARENYEQEIASIRENAIKQAEGLERRYIDQRLQDEREIGRVRREIAAAVNEESLLRREIGGEDPALIEQERKIGDAIRQYTEDKISREEEAQDRQIALSRELEDFKRQNADAINKANERYANAIGKIQQEYAKSVARLIEDGSGNGAKKLAAAGKLIAAQIARASAQEAFVTATGGAIIPRGAGSYEVAGQQMSEANLLAAAEKSSPNTKTAAKAFVKATRDIDQAQKDLNATMQITAQTSSVAIKAVSTADLEASIKSSGEALVALMATVNKEKTGLAQQNLENKILEIIKNVRSETQSNINALDRQNNAIAEQRALLESGVLPSLAEEASLRGQLFGQQERLLQGAINQLQTSEEGTALLKMAPVLHAELLSSLQKELGVLNQQEEAYANIQQQLRDSTAMLEAQKIKSQIGIVGQGLRSGFINEAGAAYEEQISKGVSPEVAASVAKATEQLTIAKSAADALQGSINGIGAAFGEAMTTGVTSLITGTATAKEVFASFLQSVGQALSQAASQMIATYIAIGIAKMFAGLSGGGGGADYSGGKVATGAFNTDSLGMGPSLSNWNWEGAGFTPFANGGVVTGPTLGLIGEGKYNEAVVPLPDGRSIPVQLGGASSRDLLSGGASKQQPSSPVLSMSFQTTKFGDKEYVDVTQLQEAMAQTRKMAAREGAAQGSQLALTKLRNSPSTRRQLGLS